MFAYDKTEGFWLIMSIPHFPPERASGFSYPHSGKVYGQSILCVSLPYSSIEEVGNYNMFQIPSSLNHQISLSFSMFKKYMFGKITPV